MFGNFQIADLIAIECSAADNFCRKELQRGIIVNERDYVSSLTGRIRDNLKRNFLVHSQTLPSTTEQSMGCDGIIVFRSDNNVKVGMFEAKWPRFAEVDYRWDYLNTRNLSHFSDQIQRQSNWHDLAIWEMFFNELQTGSQSPPCDYFGSSCVWHKHAFRFLNEKQLFSNYWSTVQLKELLKEFSLNFYSIIYNILSCQSGSVIPIVPDDTQFSVSSNQNLEPPLQIPIPINAEKEFDENIVTFLKRQNIQTYLYIDLSTITRLKAY